MDAKLVCVCVVRKPPKTGFLTSRPILFCIFRPCNTTVFPIQLFLHFELWGLSCKPNIYVSWSTSELRVRLAPLNRFKPSSKIFYWPFQGGTSFVDLLCFCSVLCLLCFVRVCLYVLRGHLLGKGWPLGSRLWCLLSVCHFPIGILGQVWYLIVSIPDLCNLTYFLKWIDQSLKRWSKEILTALIRKTESSWSYCVLPIP